MILNGIGGTHNIKEEQLEMRFYLLPTIQIIDKISSKKYVLTIGWLIFYLDIVFSYKGGQEDDEV